VVFDDHFTTVPFMEKNEVPPHWAKLIENSREKVTEEHYELAKTSLFPDPELGDISMPERNQKVSNNPNENCETTDHNFSQNSPSTEIQPPIQVGFRFQMRVIILNAPYCHSSHHLAMEK
jgi:hypothetical protein